MQNPQPMTTSTEAQIQRMELSALTVAIRAANDYNVAIISDVHLGHGRVHSSKVIESLDTMFPDERLAYLDMIVITGDLFDRRLTYGSDDALLITRWLESFLRKCTKFKVAIRILEGTPSHDNKQSRWLPLISSMSGNELDIKYYGTLTIDELYPGGPLALYVPDEVNHDASVTWMQVNELLRQRGVSQVHYAFMHGMFTYQEPIRTVVSHNVENYHSIVIQRIYIGHHHTHTVCGRIVVPGSPERLRHNEEEEKGHLQFSITPEWNTVNEYFIPNLQATVFSTYDVTGMCIKEGIALLEQYESLPTGSHLRLRLSRKDPIYSSLNLIRGRFPQFNISTKIVEAEAYTPDSEELVHKPAITAIRPDTVSNLLLERITINDVDSNVLDAIAKILAEAA